MSLKEVRQNKSLYKVKAEKKEKVQYLTCTGWKFNSILIKFLAEFALNGVGELPLSETQ